MGLYCDHVLYSPSMMRLLAFDIQILSFPFSSSITTDTGGCTRPACDGCCDCRRAGLEEASAAVTAVEGGPCVWEVERGGETELSCDIVELVLIRPLVHGPSEACVVLCPFNA